MNTSLFRLAKQLGLVLKKKKLFVATAESCTGGMLAASVTDIPGSSAYFERGFVVYSDLAKKEVLGVKSATLKKFGAVSEEVAKEMAVGVLKRSSAKIGVAITGIAGPTGGTKNKPKGMVCFALVFLGSKPKAVTRHFKGSREAVRVGAVKFILKWLLNNKDTGK